MTPLTIASSDLETINRTPITPANRQSSYELIKMQLMGAMEKRAACLARIVMNDLERRLLQRQQASPFETFLIAVILLVCVEHMCWLFRTWEHEETHMTDSKPADSTADPNLTDASLAQALHFAPPSHGPHVSHNPRWPFDKHPAYYIQQGERISDILLMLLKMRGVPPNPHTRSTDGMLVIWGDDADEQVRQWYDAIGVTNQLLAERASAPFVGEDPREWELKYVGKIISGI